MDLTGAVQDVDTLLGRDHRVAIEIGAALLKLGKIFYRLQRAL